jgi:hypothetical protein
MMSQLSLFESKKKDVETRPPNLDFIRKNLKRLLRTARNAEIMPWSEGEAESWERRFPELTALLGPEEGAEMLAAFRAEMERLKKAA